MAGQCCSCPCHKAAAEQAVALRAALTRAGVGDSVVNINLSGESIIREIRRVQKQKRRPPTTRERLLRAIWPSRRRRFVAV